MASSSYESIDLTEASDDEEEKFFGRRKNRSRSPAGERKGPRAHEQKEEKKNFRCSSKNIEITYANCPDDGTISKEIIAENIKYLHGHNLAAFIVVRELHEDGTPHYHAGVKLKKKLDTRNCRFYDIGRHHPHFSSTRSWSGYMDYCRKYDPSPIVHGEIDTDYIAAARSGDIEKSEAIFSDLYPLQYIVHLSSIRHNISILGKRPLSSSFRMSSFTPPPEFQWDTRLCLVLSGASGIGKTQFAIALAGGNALLVSHWDKLKQFKKGMVIIYDDINFVGKTREEQVHLIDYECERDINVKHGMVTIPEKTKKIITTNCATLADLLIDHPSIQRRCQWESLGDRKLYLEDIEIDY